MSKTHKSSITIENVINSSSCTQSKTGYCVSQRISAEKVKLALLMQRSSE